MSRAARVGFVAFRRGGVAALIAGVALWLGATPAAGQMELAVMQGSVTDDRGAPQEGASIRIRDTERGREIVVRSDKNGRFYRRGLQALEYEVFVGKDGYQPIQDKIKLSAGMDRRFNFKLALAAPEGAEEFARAVEAFQRGDHQAAVQAFEAAAAKAPSLPEVRVNLALAYLRVGRSEDAVAQLEKASALAPDDPRVLFQLGGAYVVTKALDKAAASFERGLAVKSDLADPLCYEATVTLGAVYFAKGDNTSAAQRFERAIAARPEAVPPKLGLAKVHFSRGEVDKALQLFRQVAAATPGSAEAAEAEAFIKELEKVKSRGDAWPDEPAPRAEA
jgi:tetratricopeptide (TPR) repeat protein